jgi:hypothetical protein
MIPLKRLEEPTVLQKNKQQWLTSFLAKREKKPGARPESTQYAHKDIVTRLEAMSFHKCFYCEQSTKPCKAVDHYIEVAEKPEGAFEWTNLYLTCGGGRSGCNNKEPNRSIPVTDCLDPCHPESRPEDHITYVDEHIVGRGSDRGQRTIQKYHLDRDDLDHKRVVQIKLFEQAMNKIQGRMIEEGRNKMSDAEREILVAFSHPDRPFSLMFTEYLKKVGL